MGPGSKNRHDSTRVVFTTDACHGDAGRAADPEAGAWPARATPTPTTIKQSSDTEATGSRTDRPQDILLDAVHNAFRPVVVGLAPSGYPSRQALQPNISSLVGIFLLFPAFKGAPPHAPAPDVGIGGT